MDFTVDFSPLAKLPEVYRQSQMRRAREMTLADLGRGTLTNEQAAQRLIAAGDMQGGMTLANLGNNQRDFQFRQQEAQRAQSNADRSYALNARKVDAAAAGASVEGQVAARRRAAQAQGLDLNAPGTQQFILTGKMPREDQQPLTATDKKAILEADEAVETNRAVIRALDDAKKYSPEANTGMGASLRASVAQNLPDWMVPDSVSSKESASATQNYDNLVIGQALTQLKSIFGGAPTEGERKILLDLQASSDKPDHVRQEIIKRAKVAAEARLKFNEQRAAAMRGGTYFKPGQQQRGGALKFNSPDEVQAAIKAGHLKSGDTFQTPDGRTKVVP